MNYPTKVYAHMCDWIFVLIDHSSSFHFRHVLIGFLLDLYWYRFLGPLAVLVEEWKLHPLCDSSIIPGTSMHNMHNKKNVITVSALSSWDRTYQYLHKEIEIDVITVGVLRTQTFSKINATSATFFFILYSSLTLLFSLSVRTKLPAAKKPASVV